MMKNSDERNEKACFKPISATFLVGVVLLLTLFMASFVSSQNYIPHQKNKDLNVVFTEGNATSCNITYIQYPDGTSNKIDIEMEKSGKTFNLTIDNNNFTQLGDTCIGVICNNPIATPEWASGSICRSITQTGSYEDLSFYVGLIALFIIGYVGLFLGVIYEYKLNILRFLCSFMLIGISVYILTNGLGSLTRDSLAVMSLGIITIGVGAYYLIKDLGEIDFSNKDGGND